MRRWLVPTVLCGLSLVVHNRAFAKPPAEEVEVSNSAPGISGGQLVEARRAEPRTLNPVFALDVESREVIALLMSDLIHLDRGSLQPVAALARTWSVSPDGRTYILHLRRGLRFSDGVLFDADDVIFTFQVHLDEQVHSSQREFLTIAGKPISVSKLDSYTVRFDLAGPYAGAERIFDGIAILPRHLLAQAYAQGKIAEVWKLSDRPSDIAGLGPFRLKEYVPGERIVLERNPWYWKVDSTGRRLPYLDRIVLVYAGSEDAQALRFQSGEAQLAVGFGPGNFRVLKAGEQKHDYQMFDAGPGPEYSFLLLNLNNVAAGTDSGAAAIVEKQKWFRQVAFRQALSLAIDRDAISRLVYQGMASPLWGLVTEQNRLWLNRTIPHPEKSVEGARALLRGAGFSWSPTGILIDSGGKEVTFTILTSAENSQRRQIATIIQDDLKQLGIKVSITSLEFRTMLDSIFHTYAYDAAIMTLASGDVDPNAEMDVLVSRGNTRLWDLNEDASTGWEKEIDHLMRLQMTTLDFTERKKDYDRVQELVARNLPFICLVSPHVLVGATRRLGNFKPSVLRPYALWNAEELFIKPANIL